MGPVLSTVDDTGIVMRPVTQPVDSNSDNNREPTCFLILVLMASNSCAPSSESVFFPHFKHVPCRGSFLQASFLARRIRSDSLAQQ